MFSVQTEDLRNTGSLNKLMLSYIAKNESIRDFYYHYPDLEGFGHLLDNKPYEKFDREVLTETLRAQASTVANTSAQTLGNIEILRKRQTYTITTGHQLCLFTGPLYFIYKIFSAINLCESLKKAFPGLDFVPVYWLAGEDHDFEEINHFNLFGNKLSWESAQKGPVGYFRNEGLEKIHVQLQEALGTSDNGNRLADLFKRSYLGHGNLASATRFLVNELFGRYGLVIVDGDEKKFKARASEYFKCDIFDNVPFETVNRSNVVLDTLGHQAQVNPRQINMFYMEPGFRERIEKTEDGFRLAGTKKKFTVAELKKMLDQVPEKFSPNVVTRPVFQQVILPNIAYVGGPAEIAYWLEYKAMFTELEVFFPILVPRSFISIIDNPMKKIADKLGFNYGDFFKDENQLVKEYFGKAGVAFNADQEKKKLGALYSELAKKVEMVDGTLSASVQSELQKAMKGIDILSAKVNKALKQKEETQINRIGSFKQKLQPKGIPQERHENFSTFYLRHGEAFLKDLKDNVNPLLMKHILLVEENE